MAFSLDPQTDSTTSVKTYPVVAIRDGVVFPHTEPTLTFGRPKSNAGIEAAFASDKHIIFISQRQPTNDPTKTDLYDIGTLCTIEQILPMGSDLLTLVKGVSRVKIIRFVSEEPYMTAEVEVLPEELSKTDHTTALAHQALTEFKRLFNLGKSIEFPIFMRLMAGVSAAELADQIANILDLNTPAKQEILELSRLESRLERVLQHLVHEIKVIELERSISSKTHAKFDRQMREQVLRERKRTIQSELEKLGADSTEDDDSDLFELRKKLKQAKLPPAVRKKVDKELSRLAQMNFNNPEANYVRNYLEWLSDMPWGTYSKSNVSLKSAEKILNQDHYGLKKVKERILEYLAVMKLKSKTSSNTTSPTILCFVGPPGVGKTSIGKSIARALGRKFIRVSLGGIRDEAEIRGHRRTYVGAMPGRIIQGIKNVGTSNPVFMLDEIDKLGTDYRGDPSSALLETLDPEQNKEFSDHYLEVPYDLSQVTFIATANMLHTIPPALRDRLEIIGFPGYTLEEKLHIAKDYLWPKQLEVNGLPKSIAIPDSSIKDVVVHYTREAGVRSLERQLAKICRKLAREHADAKSHTTEVSPTQVKKYLGPERIPETLAEKKDEIGMSTGLSWSESGGDILFIEVALMPGKGDLQLTGQLGEVMRESARAAFSYVRSKWEKLGLTKDFYKEIDIHIHVPEGATPKDGPSAGLAIATALISALTSTAVRQDTAMTGEITLRGRALEIGGVKEKVIAAHRAGIKHVILPKDNKKDLEDVPTSVKRDLGFHFVTRLDDVLPLAFRSKN
jgi:ATP-dependent Lon protease